MNPRVLAVAVALLAAGCGSSSPAASPTGAVTGRVLSAPSCPVERAGVPCPPRPVVGASVAALQEDRVVASTRSGRGGWFRLALPAGRYVVRATNVGGYGSTAQRNVTVDPRGGAAPAIRLVVDSGIR
jgi:hypothetical protein